MAKSLRSNIFHGIFFITFLLMLVPFAASSAAEQRVLSLDKLIEMALENSPELKMAEQDILAAKSDLNQAKAGMLPQLDLVAITGPINDAKVPTVAINGNVGRLVSHDEDGIGIFGRLDFAITQPLYTFGKISNRKEAAAFGVEAQHAGREGKRNEVVLNVKELYYAYLVAAQGKSAAREADDFINDAGKRIRRLIELKAKNADTSDLYRLDAFSAEVKSFAAKADSGSRLAYAALKRTVGVPDNQEFRLDVTGLSKKTVTLDPEGEYVMRALAARPEITQVKKGVEAKKKMVAAAKADLYPSFFAAAIGSVAGAPNREELDDPYIGDDFNHAYAGVIAGAEWHFDLGIGKGKLDKARAEYQKMRHTQEFAERNIPLEVMKHYQDVIENEKTFQAYEQAAVGSRRWIVAAFSNFDVGVGTARDMFDAIDRYGKNQGEYLRALYNYHVALARLNYATGNRAEMR
ncbi:MAG: TolC family protein [Syntrophobacteraceae bacterium]